ncbi:MAG TPA: hypothetical protein VKB63_07575 [Gemmatimonadales bacterium]|nr:hypothetical protein [Gemmatimonadales bacterium]
MATPLIELARLDAAERDALARAIAGQTTLEQALDWARTLTPPRGVESVLTQDEYTHDVLIAYGTRWLVYDTS